MATSLAAAATHGLAAAAAPLPASGESLQALARAKGARFGTAIGTRASDAQASAGLEQADYCALVARECGLVVPENELKWRALRPSATRFDFTRADRILHWAAAQGLAVRGHTLMWHGPEWWPRWLQQHDFGAHPRAEAEWLLGEHVRRVVQHCGAAVTSWDVVNESVQPETGRLRDNLLTLHLGNLDQIELAFRAAHEAAPQAQLVYNDFMSWGDHAARHRAGVLQLLEQLLARGVPVHALGLQSHIGTGSNGQGTRAGGQAARDWSRFLDTVSGMGLQLLITELDVNDRYLPPDIAQRDATAAALLRDYLDVTLAQPRLRDILSWGLADHLSWMITWWPRADGLPKRATPYDAQLQPKPLREALAAALRAMPERRA